MIQQLRLRVMQCVYDNSEKGNAFRTSTYASQTGIAGLNSIVKKAFIITGSLLVNMTTYEN